ncbi:MAG: hypothetical protein ACR2QV_05065 [Gammaproteobacteria bacterium]
MSMHQSLLAIVLAFFAAATHGATVVYDTLSDTTGPAGVSYNIGVPPSSAAPPRSTAMRFVPSEGGFLTAIDVYLSEHIGTDWSVSASVYPDVGGRPGQSALESVSYTGGTAWFAGALSLVASGTTWLDPAEAYWLGIAPETEGMFVGWQRSQLATPGSNKAQTFAELDGFWFIILPDDNQAGFRMSVNTAIPIPAAVWLFGSALGLLVCTKRRNA